MSRSTITKREISRLPTIHNGTLLTVWISVDFRVKLSLLRLDISKVTCALTIRARLAFWNLVVARCLGLGVEALDNSDSLLML